MSNDVDKYLGPHKKLGPGSYELGPIPVVGKWQSGIEFGGGYTVWGLNEGPRRGEGGPSNIHEVAKPNVIAEFMNEQIYNQAEMDNNYKVRINTLMADVDRELQERKLAVKGAQTLDDAKTAVIDQRVTLELIEFKQHQSSTIAPDIYGLYGQSPYFLMTLLARQKIHDFFSTANGSNPRQVLKAIFDQFDQVYTSAMELKVLSLSIDALAGKLPELAMQVEQTQVAGDEFAQLQRLVIILRERDIHARQLPEFLYAELVAAAGAMEGMGASEALTHYKTTLEQLGCVKSRRNPTDICASCTRQGWNHNHLPGE